MRKTAFFILGFCFGAFVCVMLMFVLSMFLSQFAIQLYESESDQQRNFNFFVVAGLIFGLVGGFLVSKKFN